MTGSLFDSQMFAKLFPTGEVGRLFTDTAEVRSMMIVEGTLAKVQGEMGIIPEISANAIHRASLELQIDPSGLAASIGKNGVSVPGLVAAFRELMQAPEHAQYLHWGATSQDIIDTAQALRLRQMLSLMEGQLGSILKRLADLAEAHADLPMAARTYGQYAKPSSFGALLAIWGNAMIPIFQALETLRDGVLWVSLSGAAGTGSEFGPEAATLRANFAKALNLRDPEYSWHADRGPIQRLTAWLLQLSQSLGKIGEDITLMMQSGLGEVTLGATGGSSTMPQKQNPVHPSALVALTHHARGAGTALQSAAMPRQARDGAAWFTEWLSLPSLCLAVASQLELTSQVLAGLAPNTVALASPLNDPLGLIHAEALTFQLANDMPRPEAQDIVKALCKTAQNQQAHLISLAAQAHGIDPAQFAPENQMGHAPQEARSFATRARLAVNGT